MFLKNRGRMVVAGLVASMATVAAAQSPTSTTTQKPGKAAAANGSLPVPKAQALPPLRQVQIPVNPTDPIAVINGEVITRQQLSDECVALEGKKVLETLIARRLIDQAMRQSKLQVTPAEVDQEIENVGMATARMTGEVWLRTLEANRGISPARYRRDIIYPTLALKKLAASRVQVTENDLKEAFAANFGERVRCRMIMVNSLQAANAIWNELQKNPDGFDRIAKERSMDQSTRASGGMIPEPIARYANPRTISKAIFEQLVDGNAGDKDSNGKPIKPKDGSITGPIQLDANFVIIRRDELLPAKESAKFSDPNVQSMLKAQVAQAKQEDAVASMFYDLMKASTIDNKLTGQVKMANEDEQAAEARQAVSDQGVKLMSNPGETAPPAATGNRVPSNIKTTPANAPVTPSGVPADAVSTARQVQSQIRAGTPAPPK